MSPNSRAMHTPRQVSPHITPFYATMRLVVCAHAQVPQGLLDIILFTGLVVSEAKTRATGFMPRKMERKVCHTTSCQESVSKGIRQPANKQTRGRAEATIEFCFSHK